MVMFRRWVALGAVVALCVGCSGGTGKAARTTSTRSAGTSTPRIEAVRVPMQAFPSSTPYGLTFEHPRAWRETRYVAMTSFSALVVLLSTQPVRSPQVTRITGGGTVTTGRTPLVRLAPGGVLVSWNNVGFPHVGPEIPHPNAKFGGQPATFETARPSIDCAQVGGTVSVMAQIARPHGNQYDMSACLRAPGVSANERLVRQMLDSVRITA
jgi:hypothetical protein